MSLVLDYSDVVKRAARRPNNYGLLIANRDVILEQFTNTTYAKHARALNFTNVTKFEGAIHVLRELQLLDVMTEESV